MDRRAFTCAAAGALWASPRVAGAQTGGRVYRLGILSPGTVAPASDAHMQNAYTAPLRELGHVEGQNLVVERRLRMAGAIDCRGWHANWST